MIDSNSVSVVIWRKVTDETSHRAAKQQTFFLYFWLTEEFSEGGEFASQSW